MTDVDAPVANPDPGERRHPALVAAAIALPAALIVGVIVAAVLAGRVPATEPVALGPVPAPAAGGPQCTALLPALPNDLGPYSNAELAAPAPKATKAWQQSGGNDPIVLRCGLDRPLEFNKASALQVVDGVEWFEVAGSDGMKSSTYFAVDRGTYIGLTVPDGSGPTPLQSVSDAITQVIPQQPIDPGPLPN
ncbi:DUF3515 domain-containing protein [Antrihabitans cavernicola]|uniref:DUF3515 domain-containing protein n=1 Tax=Antrihabitans cavernicola TaxID=2495913 RepID=A0A5A7SGC3_9NOCA|nr:DUF3515 domain-containing protein [Spelaeibacter cavernicola]KAA0024242.1 DUF3515 domain-containing protein [Spelaeibacter cavernicola]